MKLFNIFLHIVGIIALVFTIAELVSAIGAPSWISFLCGGGITFYLALKDYREYRRAKDQSVQKEN